MIKIAILDVDGVVIDSPKRRFSQRLAIDCKLNYENDILPFFQKEFQKCLIGRADLKQEILPYIKKWKWPDGVEELLEYWFREEAHLNAEILSLVENLSTKKISCFLGTNNEKYRTEYLWNTLGLCKKFDGIFSSAYLGATKTEQKFWEKTHTLLGEPDKKSVFMFDDDMKNVEAAKDFGYEAEFFTSVENFKTILNEKGLVRNRISA